MMPHHPAHCLSRFLLLSGGLLLGVLLAVSDAQVPSAITPDGTLGTVVTPDGRIFNITGGTRPDQGPNLFHSFNQFDVGTGDTAHFVGQPGIDNIIGRVTGGSASLIDGRLQSDASLFLLNPSGLLFGPNATLDVNGSFHASTADVLRFADGAAFSAHLNEKSTLTVAAPSAFGFLSEHPVSMTIERSYLEVHEGEALSIVGGNIDVVGGTLKAPGGRVTVVGVASPGDTMLSNAELLAEIDLEDFDRLGDIRITQEGLIDTQGPDGGSVVLRGGHLMIDNASIQGGTIRDMGDHEAGIDIEMAETILLTNGGVIRTVAQGDQDTADIRVTTGDLHIEGASFIVSRTSSAGRAGDVSVNAANVTVLEGSQINSLTFGPGAGGTVSIRSTDTVTLSGISEDGELSSGIFANSQGTEAGAGAAGSVEIEAANVTVADGAVISSSAFGPGTGGQIRIEATDSVMLVGTTTLLDASGPSGGTIRIGSGRLLIDGARTFADTTGDAHGPKIGIDIQVDGEVILTHGARVAADGFGNGNAGSIQVIADRLEISEGSLLRSRTAEGSTGGAGTIVIAASDVQVAGEGTRIDAETRGSGPAGAIQIETDRLVITEGAQISTTTRGPGPGGILTVLARESINITDKIGGQFRSGLFSNSGEGEGGEPTGDAGDIVIKAPQLIVDGGRILTRTLGDGNAGNIIIDVDRLELLGGGQIFNGVGNAEGNGEILGNPDGTGRGGLLTVRATAAVIITGEDLAGFSSGLFSSAQIGHGNAGDVVIITPTLDMRDGGSIAARTLNQSTGTAGNINVQVGQLILTEGANISSSTNGVGQGGQVTIVATEDIVITGRSSEGILSGVFTDTTGQGRGGDIILSAPQVQITDRSTVSAESAGKGDAGNIRIAAQEIALRGGSAVTTTVEQGEASGGNILIGGTITDDGTITEGVETLTLDGSQITANTDTGSGANITIGVQRLVLDGASALSANTGAGTGGNLRMAGAVTADGTITARADTVVLRGSRLTANAGPGMGGRIDIVTEAFLADPASIIDASSQAGGIDGVVNVEAVVSNLSEIVTPLPPDFASAAELLRDRCAAQLHEGTVSSLVARGRASIPATPEGLLPSRLYQPAQASAAPPETEQQPAETDAPQQGMVAVAPLGRPQIIRGPFPAHAPVALKCNWTPP